jgi:hypothetical protein
LADARGNLFSLKEANIRDLENGNGTKEYTLVFAAPNGSALPDKLVYKGQQKLIVEVPFTLKDVDLP